MHLNKNDKSGSNEDLAYKQLLRNIAYLRSKGYEDTDPKLVKLRGRLRDILEKRKKEKKKSNKVVPNLLGYRTVALANVDQSPSSNDAKLPQSKYVLLGTLLGAAGVAYYIYQRFNT